MKKTAEPCLPVAQLKFCCPKHDLNASKYSEVKVRQRKEEEEK